MSLEMGFAINGFGPQIAASIMQRQLNGGLCSFNDDYTYMSKERSKGHKMCGLVVGVDRLPP